MDYLLAGELKLETTIRLGCLPVTGYGSLNVSTLVGILRSIVRRARLPLVEVGREHGERGTAEEQFGFVGDKERD